VNTGYDKTRTAKFNQIQIKQMFIAKKQSLEFHINLQAKEIFTLAVQAKLKRLNFVKFLSKDCVFIDF